MPYVENWSLWIYFRWKKNFLLSCCVLRSELYGESFSDLYGCNMQQNTKVFKVSKEHTLRKANRKDLVKAGWFIYPMIVYHSPVPQGG